MNYLFDEMPSFCFLNLSKNILDHPTYHDIQTDKHFQLLYYNLNEFLFSIQEHLLGPLYYFEPYNDLNSINHIPFHYIII
jgi:hypothetical protein